MVETDGHGSIDWSRSARRDFSFWMLLLVGVAFMWCGFTIDPETNCSESGECAPWLVPVAAVMGIGAVAIAAGTLLANPGRGCRFDSETGEIVWWKNRVRGHAGDGGRIDPHRISRLRIENRGEDDCVHVFDAEGHRLAFFDEEVMPWPYDRWAARLVARWPHIRIEDMRIP